MKGSDIPLVNIFINDEKEWQSPQIQIITNEGNKMFKVYCYGRIEYKDIFDKELTRGFCWEQSPMGGFIDSDNEELNYYK
jgi:putative heme iron utilization protein